MLDTGKLRARISEWRVAFEERLAALVEIPTVSMDPQRRADMGRGADLAGRMLGEIGAHVDVVDTGGYPLVVGRVLRDPAFPTVTIYNHLDVQPADPAEWRTPPFSFVRDGDRYFARGTTDDKGPALSALYGARLALETDARVNIQFLWELEEEIGSPNFARGLGAAIAGAPPTGRAPFSTDSVVVSDTIWTAAGRPSIPYGLRGLMGFTVELQTGAKDVHSGTTGGAARNPVAELAALIADCVDARTGRVKIPGFYAGVRKLTAIERKGFARWFLGAPLSGGARAQDHSPAPRRFGGDGGHHGSADLRGARAGGGLRGARHQDHRPAPGRGQVVHPPGSGSTAGTGVQVDQGVHQEALAGRAGCA